MGKTENGTIELNSAAKAPLMDNPAIFWIGYKMRNRKDTAAE